MIESPLYVYHFAVALEQAHPLPVLENLHSDAVRLLAARLERREVRQVDGRLFLDDTPGLALVRIGLDVLLDDVHIVDECAPVGQHLEHGASLALVPARKNHDVVALSDLVHHATSFTELPAPAR